MTARIRHLASFGVRWTGAHQRRAVVRAGCCTAIAIADAIAVVLCLAVAATVGEPSLDLVHAAWPAPLAIAGAMAGSVMLILLHRGHYGRRLPFWSSLGDILTASAAGLLGSLVILLALGPQPLLAPALLTPLTAFIILPLAIVAARRTLRGAFSAAGLWELRAVIIGSAEAAHAAAGALTSEPAMGYRVAATIRPAAPLHNEDWAAVLATHRADLVVLAPQSEDGLENGLEGATEALMRARIPFALVPSPDGLPVQGLQRTSFFSHDTVLLTYRDNLAQPLSRLVKLAFDLVVATIMLLVLSPILATVAVLVALDGGPILYRHMRIGAGGRPFPCLKFRSMVPDGDRVLATLLATDPQAALEWSETRKLRRDPRITWVGRHLRSTSLDELPQLLNVLRLEMSLVGPRPIVEAEIPRYGDAIAYYMEARPGLTGLWQVSGRSDTGYAQRVRLDTWYVKNWTVWHDLAILAKTVPAVLARRGAL